MIVYSFHVCFSFSLLMDVYVLFCNPNAGVLLLRKWQKMEGK